MVILICGDRNWTDREAINRLISTFPQGTIIIQGGARGADTIAKDSATAHGLVCKTYKAQWEQFGYGAGPIRNKLMLTDGKPDMVFAFHNDIKRSKGTKNMVNQAEKAGVPVVIIGS